MAPPLRLDLRGRDLESLPPLPADLEELDIGGNPRLCSLPASLASQSRLRVLFASGCGFEELPAVLGRLPSLRMVAFRGQAGGGLRCIPPDALPPSLEWLILTENRLASLPAAIGGCARLRKLMLAGNELTELPVELARCRRLELLRVSANRLAALPRWLSALPRLAWLAFADNPCCARGFAGAGGGRTPLPSMPWSQLALGERIGDGASGVVYAAAVRGAGAGGGAEAVAVKVFKRGITSDGWPSAELAASVAAGGGGGGAAASLLAARATVTGHPDGAGALLMPLLGAATHARLADPPTFDSVTRDAYAPDACWPLAAALRTATSVARALAHLHAVGVLHGDVYGHNILVARGGEAALGDLGAASPLHARWEGGEGKEGDALLERLDVLALGHLIDELLARCEPPAAAAAAAAAAQALARDCTREDAAARPDAAAALAALEKCCEQCFN